MIWNYCVQCAIGNFIGGTIQDLFKEMKTKFFTSIAREVEKMSICLMMTYGLDEKVA
jgi:hypothetical protein